MAKEIVWSETAQNDRREIFSYWNNRNKSTQYSEKLNELIISAVDIIAKYPQIGKLSGYKDTRMKIVRDYLIVYKEFANYISILTIWDWRQDPKKLGDILG